MKQMTKKLTTRFFRALLLCCIGIGGFSALTSAAALKIGDEYGGGKVAYIVPVDDPSCKVTETPDMLLAGPYMDKAGNADWSFDRAVFDTRENGMFGNGFLKSSSNL